MTILGGTGDSQCAARLSHLDVRLHFLIDKAELTTPSPFRRLNAIENLLTRLGRMWRPETRLIVPATEVRMSPATYLALGGWVEQAEAATGTTQTRLLAYSSAAVLADPPPDGWIRLVLSSDLVQPARRGDEEG